MRLENEEFYCECSNELWAAHRTFLAIYFYWHSEFAESFYQD